MQVAECFSKVADLAHALGVKHINELPGLWEHQVNDEWKVSANGHDNTIECCPPGSIKIENLKYFCVGVVSARGGCIMGGQEAEDSFIAAVDKAIACVASVNTDLVKE
jgi:hypothetical protein